MKSNLIIKNGQCITMDGNKICQWIAIRDGQILETGNGEDYTDLINEDTVFFDACGKSVLPGFIDNHCHLVAAGINAKSIDLNNIDSVDEIGRLLQEKAEKTQDDFIVAFNFQRRKVKGRLDRYTLDKYVNSKPVVILSVDYHMTILNSHGMLFFKIPFAIEGIEHDENNVPTGVFSKGAGAVLKGNINQTYSEKYRDKVLIDVMDGLHHFGITTVAAMEADNGYITPLENKNAEFLCKYKDKYPLGIEVFYQTTNVEKVLKLGLGRIGGALYVDGTIGGKTAAISLPYEGEEENKGIFCIDKEGLNALTLQCYENNLQLALDAIGDEAVEWVLQAHEYAALHEGKSHLRHRIEHCVLVTEDQIKRAKALGLVFSMQPIYEKYAGGQGNLYEKRIGERYKRSNAFGTIMRMGMTICAGSDLHIDGLNPLAGVNCLINHSNEEERVTLFEALKMYTYNGAYALNLEKQIGALRKGMTADIIVFNENLEQIEDITKAQVVMTIKDGQLVYFSQEKGDGQCYR